MEIVVENNIFEGGFALTEGCCGQTLFSDTLKEVYLVLYSACRFLGQDLDRRWVKIIGRTSLEAESQREPHQLSVSHSLHRNPLQREALLFPPHQGT